MIGLPSIFWVIAEVENENTADVAQALAAGAQYNNLAAAREAARKANTLMAVYQVSLVETC